MKKLNLIALNIVFFAQAAVCFASYSYKDDQEADRDRMMREIHILHELSRSGQATEEQLKEVHEKYGMGQNQLNATGQIVVPSRYSLEN